jgi:hypothetical protein
MCRMFKKYITAEADGHLAHIKSWERPQKMDLTIKRSSWPVTSNSNTQASLRIDTSGYQLKMAIWANNGESPPSPGGIRLIGC